MCTADVCFCWVPSIFLYTNVFECTSTVFSNPVCAQNISIPEIRSSNLNFLTDIYLTCLQLLILLVSREMVASLQASLVMATHVAKTGDPDFQRMADWLKISCE